MQQMAVKKNDLMQDLEIIKANSKDDYLECIRDLIAKRPFGDHKFYIFSFTKRMDDVYGIKKMFHQPRLTKPEPLPQTSLIKVDPKNPDWADVKWMLPEKESFKLFKHGKIFADESIHRYVQTYLKNPALLCQPDPDDLSDDQIRQVYIQIAQERKRKIQSI